VGSIPFSNDESSDDAPALACCCPPLLAVLVDAVLLPLLAAVVVDELLVPGGCAAVRLRKGVKRIWISIFPAAAGANPVMLRAGVDTSCLKAVSGDGVRDRPLAVLASGLPERALKSNDHQPHDTVRTPVKTGKKDPMDRTTHLRRTRGGAVGLTRGTAGPESSVAVVKAG